MINFADKEVNGFIEKIFRLNMLQLFDLDGNFRTFEHQRHICSSLREIPGKTKKEKIKNSILGALYLCEIWRVHLIQSFYPFPYYICVQLENDWLENNYGKGTPPYVVLVTKNLVERVMNNPFFYNVKAEIDINIQNALNSFFCPTRFNVKKNNENNIWRFVPVPIST
jgi:hypothetical protein